MKRNSKKEFEMRILADKMYINFYVFENRWKMLDQLSQEIERNNVLITLR